LESRQGIKERGKKGREREREKEKERERERERFYVPSKFKDKQKCGV